MEIEVGCPKICQIKVDLLEIKLNKILKYLKAQIKIHLVTYYIPSMTRIIA